MSPHLTKHVSLNYRKKEYRVGNLKTSLNIAFLVIVSILIFLEPSLALSVIQVKEKELELRFSFPSADLVEKGVYLHGASLITLNTAQRIYISNILEHEIVEFDLMGRFLSRFGQNGQGPGEFNRPRRLMFVNDRILVHDWDNRRIQFFDNKRNYLKSFKLLKTYYDMANNKEGLIFAAPRHNDGESSLVDVLSQDGRLLYSFGEPMKFKNDWIQLNRVSLAINDNDEILIAFKFFPIVRKFSVEGKLLEEYKIKHKRLIDYEKSNKARYRKALLKERGSPEGYWGITFSIEVTSEGFYLLNCHPDILILEFDNEGNHQASYRYFHSKDYLSSDFLVLNHDNEKHFYLLQTVPDNRVDVFEIKKD